MNVEPDSDLDVFEGGVGKRTGVGTGELDLDFESLRCLCGTEDKGCFLESDVDRLEGEGEGMGLGEVRMARFLTLARCEGIGGPFAILVRGSASRPFGSSSIIWLWVRLMVPWLDPMEMGKVRIAPRLRNTSGKFGRSRGIRILNPELFEVT